MFTIKVTTNSETRVIEAAGIGGTLVFSRFNAWQLEGPVKVDGTEIPSGARIDFGDGAVEFDKESANGDVKLSWNDQGAFLQCFKAANNGLMKINACDLQDAPHNLGAFNGSIGPFNYDIDVHIDTDNIMNSYFYVVLSVFGINLVNVRLDANNPKVTIDASVLGVGVEGTVGVDFSGCRVYAEITLKYLFGQKTYTFDIYNWGNCSATFTPVEANNDAFCMAVAGAANSSGWISVYSTGAYVARFSVAYTQGGARISKDSGEFTAGVTKTIDLPADATDIVLHVQDAYFFGSWRDIFSKHFDEPVCKSYHIWGTTLITDYEEM